MAQEGCTSDQQQQHILQKQKSQGRKSGRKNNSRHQDLEAEILDALRGSNEKLNEVEHAFNAHSLRILKHLNPDEQDDCLEEVQAVVNRHVKAARQRRNHPQHTQPSVPSHQGNSQSFSNMQNMFNSQQAAAPAAPAAAGSMLQLLQDLPPMGPPLLDATNYQAYQRM